MNQFERGNGNCLKFNNRIIYMNKMYDVCLPVTETVPLETRWKVCNLLRSANYPRPEDGFDWRIKTERGTIEKRIKRFLYKQGIKPDNSFMGILGSTVGKQAVRGITKHYTCLFTDVFDWSPGDFKDPGSCFWDNDKSVLKILTRNNILAMLFWTKISIGEFNGAGRCWVIPRNDPNIPYILFNLYGLELYELGMAFEQITGLKLAVIDLENANNERIYINVGIGYAAMSEEYLSNNEIQGEVWGTPALNKKIKLEWKTSNV